MGGGYVVSWGLERDCGVPTLFTKQVPEQYEMIGIDADAV
jgi:hypothetical protein